MFCEVARGHGLARDPFKALIATRPIGWVSTMNTRGEVNLSHYSFFNLIAERLHLVSFSSQEHKDSMIFAEEGGDFVCNLANWDLRHEVNTSAMPFPRGVNEIDAVRLLAEPSRLVRPPRVADAAGALECQWIDTVQLKGVGGKPAEYFLVIGEVLGIHIDDRFLTDGQLDTAAMRPIMRGGYQDYFMGNEIGRCGPPLAAHRGSNILPNAFSTTTCRRVRHNAAGYCM